VVAGLRGSLAGAVMAGGAGRGAVEVVVEMEEVLEVRVLVKRSEEK